MLQTQATETDRQAGITAYSAAQGTFKLRVQKIEFIEIEVQAGNIDEAENIAFERLKAHPEAGTLLRTDFGHRTIEKL